MRAADERLLSGKDKPEPNPVAPAVLDKPAAPKRTRAGSKPKAPTTGTNKTKDAKPSTYGNLQDAVDSYVAEKVAEYRQYNPFMSDDEIKRYYALPPYGTL